MNDKVQTKDNCGATVVRGGSLTEAVNPKGQYEVVCVGPDGRVKWRDTIYNLVTTVGKNLLLDAILGNAAAGVVRMGLKGAGSAAAGDTQASHAGWNRIA